MPPPPQPDDETPHDVLAADEFALGEADRSLHHEAPHDVLAADAFPLPAPEHHAVPPDGAASASASQARATSRRWVLAAAALTVLALAARRHRG